MRERSRVRLVFELECDFWSLLALRAALRDWRLARRLRFEVAELLEKRINARTGSESAWRYLVTCGKLEVMSGAAEQSDALASGASESESDAEELEP